MQVHTEQELDLLSGCLLQTCHRGPVSDCAMHAQPCSCIRCLGAEKRVPYCSPSTSRTLSRLASDKILLQLSSAGSQ